MENNKLIQSLHAYERKVLSVLDKKSTVSEIAQKSSLQEIEVMRGLQWLENKQLVKTEEEIKELADLDKNGKRYVKEGLPEKRFLQAVGENTPISEIKRIKHLSWSPKKQSSHSDKKRKRAYSIHSTQR